MSGTNPFRRKNIHEEEPGTLPQENNLISDYHHESRTPTIATELRKPTKKTVRIISPHSAGSDDRTRIPDVLFSPPPLLNRSPGPQSVKADHSEGDSSSEDPFEVDSDDGGGTTEDEDLRRNTLENSGSSHDQNSGKHTETPNPFDRTPTTTPLANVENGRGSRVLLTEPKRPQYNVDEFTRLLLTGKKPVTDITPATPSLGPPHAIHVAAGDTSSNTDASSISRQSIFEPPTEVHQETPRTSHELSSSDGERQQLMRSPSLAKEKKKPAAPQSQHGKPMADNSQFETHEESLPPVTRINEATVGRPSSGSPRTPTDLNKPLPPPPMSEALEFSRSNTVDSIGPELDYQSASPSRRKAPPPPPSARRQGQAKPKLPSSDIEHLPHALGLDLPSLTTQSSTFRDLPIRPSDTIARPPPPPPRRPGAPVRGLSTSSTTSGVSMIPTPSSSTFSKDSNSNKSRPPVPPTRNRSSSSAKKQMMLPTQISSTGLPPAPPPRRRGSSQSSFSPLRISGEYQSSFGGRPRTDSGASSVQSKDVMADLSALQKEVDALRGKFGT